MTNLSTGNDAVVGYGAVEGASWGVDYDATSHGVEGTGSVEGGILGYGMEVNSGLWIWSGNVTAPSWECPSLRRHGCKQFRPRKEKMLAISSFLHRQFFPFRWRRHDQPYSFSDWLLLVAFFDWVRQEECDWLG